MVAAGRACEGITRSTDGGGGDESTTAGSGNSSSDMFSLSSVTMSGGLAGHGAGGSFLVGSGAGVGTNIFPDLLILSSSKLTSLADN